MGLNVGGNVKDSAAQVKLMHGMPVWVSALLPMQLPAHIYPGRHQISAPAHGECKLTLSFQTLTWPTLQAFLE